MKGFSRRTFLCGATALCGSVLRDFEGAASELMDVPCGKGAVSSEPNSTSLAALAARQGRFFGCSVKDQLFTDLPFQSLVLNQCNMLVCTYSMKRRHLERQPGQFNFKSSDRYVDFATLNGMKIRGHALVWEKELPPWAADELFNYGFAALERYIRGVSGHYAGRLHSWDVVNEAVMPGDGRQDRLKDNIFLQTLGPSYIAAAFSIAREADPEALLYYNANPAPYRREGERQHFESVIALLERLISRNVPVQGLGLQGHLTAAFDDQFDETMLVWFFERASALNLEIAITELDVTDKWLPQDVSLRDRRVAASYRRLLDVALDFIAFKGVLTWGLSDRYTGLNRWRRQDGWAVRGLPYDHCLQPKLARDQIAAAFLAHEPDRG